MQPLVVYSRFELEYLDVVYDSLQHVHEFIDSSSCRCSDLVSSLNYLRTPVSRVTSVQSY